jgi:hypothetical protein
MIDDKKIKDVAKLHAEKSYIFLIIFKLAIKMVLLIVPNGYKKSS